MTLTTSQIRDLRDAAERAERVPIHESRISEHKAYAKRWHEYIAKADPTTVKALCDELIARRSHDPQPRERTK